MLTHGQVLGGVDEEAGLEQKRHSGVDVDYCFQLELNVACLERLMTLTTVC